MRDLSHMSVRALAAVAVAVLCCAVPSLASAATTPSWSAPAAITTEAPFADQGTLTQISCATASDCAAGAIGQTATGVIYATSDAGQDWTIARAPNAAGGGPFACAPDSDGAAPFCIALAGDEVENLLVPGAPVTGPSNDALPLELATALSCPSARLCVATGASGSTGEVDWSTNPLSGAWSSATVDPQHALTAISCPDANLCVAVDSGGGMEVSTDPTAGAWSRTRVGSGLDAVSCPTDGWCVAVSASGGAYVSTAPAGGDWTEENAETDFAGVSCATADSCVATGSDGTVYRSSGSAGGFTVSATGLPTTLGAISCPTDSQCEAVDGPDVESGQPVSAGGSGVGWTTDAVDAWTPLAAVSCPSQALCVALQQDGRADTTTAPLNESLPWTVSAADPGGTPVALSCTVSGACFGVDTDGRLIWSPHPAVTGWRAVRLDHRAEPVAISCPTAAFCAIADAGGRIFTSTDPEGGTTADWHMVRRATPTKVSHEQTETLTAIDCVSARFCTATDSGGWIYTSSDPRGAASAWKATQIWKRPSSGYYSLTAVSCPTTTNCTVAATDAGWFRESQYDPDALGTYALTSSDPAGGSRRWTRRHIDAGYVESDASTNDPGIATGLSCPTASLCAMVDDLGTADTNTATAGSNRWQQASIDPLAGPEGSDGSPGLTAVSCFEGGHCVAVDGFGNRFVFGIGAGSIVPAPGTSFQGG